LYHRPSEVLSNLNYSDFTNIVIDQDCANGYISNSYQRDNSEVPKTSPELKQEKFKDLEVKKIYYPHTCRLVTSQSNQQNNPRLFQRRKNEPETALTFFYCLVPLQSTHLTPLKQQFNFLVRFRSNVVLININNKKIQTM